MIHPGYDCHPSNLKPIDRLRNKATECWSSSTLSLPHPIVIFGSRRRENPCLASPIHPNTKHPDRSGSSHCLEYCLPRTTTLFDRRPIFNHKHPKCFPYFQCNLPRNMQITRSPASWVRTENGKKLRSVRERKQKTEIDLFLSCQRGHHPCHENREGLEIHDGFARVLRIVHAIGLMKYSWNYSDITAG